MKKKLAFLTILMMVGLSLGYFHFHRKHQLALCAVFKDEAPRLEEWIEYHLCLGATHFYLYDCGSTDNFKEVLNPYIQEGVVELIDWSFTESPDLSSYEISAFNDCLKHRARGQARWVAMQGVDEFIVFPKGRHKLKSLLKKAYRSSVGSLQLNQLVFGTSYIRDIDPGELLTANLYLRAPDHHPSSQYTRAIHRPEAVKQCFEHDAQLGRKYQTKLIDRSQCRMHHYGIGTENMLLSRGDYSEDEVEKISEEFNCIKDCAIFRTLNKMKRKVNIADYSLCDFNRDEPLAYIVPSRGDRYGSNVTCWIASILLAKINNIPLYHYCELECIQGQVLKHKMYHKILTDYCEKGIPPKGSKILHIEEGGWPIKLFYLCRKLMGSDIPTGVRKLGFSSKWFDYFDRHAKTLGWKLRWDPKKAIVIHVRLSKLA